MRRRALTSAVDLEVVRWWLVVNSCIYSPDGTTETASESFTNPWRWVAQVGYYHDTSIGLDHVGARRYDSSVGRWTQPDPSGQQANTYGYATGNPVNYLDPTGKVPTAPITVDMTCILDPAQCRDIIQTALGAGSASVRMQVLGAGIVVAAATSGVSLSVSVGSWIGCIVGGSVGAYAAPGTPGV